MTPITPRVPERAALTSKGRTTIWRPYLAPLPAGWIQSFTEAESPETWYWVGRNPLGYGPMRLGDPFTCPYGGAGTQFILPELKTYTEEELEILLRAPLGCWQPLGAKLTGVRPLVPIWGQASWQIELIRYFPSDE